MNVTFSIPGAPKAKQRPRMTKSGIAYTPAETVSYENLVKLVYSEKCGNAKLEGEVKAIIVAYYPIPASTSKRSKALMIEGKMAPTKKPDCDNVAKVILDSLNNIAYKDDSCITQLYITKQYSDNPRVDVKLEEVEHSTPTFSV